MKYFIFCFLLAMIGLTTSQGQCENWKEYYKDDDTIFYYDKDSIHYPRTKKSIFGTMVRNKEIVNVWTRDLDKKSGRIGRSELWTIYCATRARDNHRPYDPRNPFDVILGPPQGPIEPGDIYERLLKKVCP